MCLDHLYYGTPFGLAEPFAAARPRWRTSEQHKDRFVARKRVFISFDFDNDADLRGNLVAQSKRQDSPFSIVDWSLKAPYDERWKQKVRGIIRRADLTVIICGEFTSNAPGVAAELTISKEVGTPYVLLRGRRHRPCTRPSGARSKDEMHAWTWKTLHELFSA